MAITITDRGFTQSTPGVNATTTLASGSFSPTGGRVLVVRAYIDDVTGPSFDGDSITISDSFTGTSAWTTGVYKHQLGAGGTYCVAAGIYVATLGASPGTGTVTATFNRPNGSEDNWKTLQVYELAGASGSVGASGSTLNRPAGAGTISVTLSGAPASTSLIVGHCDNGSQTTAAIVQPSGWTEQQDTAAPSSWGDESEDAYLNGGGITTFSWSGLITTDTAMAIAVEILADSTAPTGTVAQTLANFAGAASGTVFNRDVGYIKQVGTVTNTTATGTADTITVATGGVVAGDTIVITGACDNTGASGIATTIAVADNSSQSGSANTYTLQTPQAIADPGNASAGQQGFLVVCNVTRKLLAGDVITITYGNATTAKAIRADQYAGVNSTTPVLSATYAHTDNQTTTASSVAATATHAGQAFVGGVAVEGGTADTFTQDSDTTNGSWVNPGRIGSGTTTSGSTLNPIYKLVTASGAQTYNPTLGTARDSATMALILDTNPVSGTVAVTLGAFVGAASGTHTPSSPTGTVAVTLAAFAGAATGTIANPVTGTSAQTLAAFASAATGTETITGTSAQTLAALASAATGAVANPITGTVAVTLAALTSTATGSVANPVSGTVAVTLANFAGAAAGATSSGPITGTVAVTLADFPASASGTETITGTVARTLATLVGAATGTETITGTVARTLASFTSSAAGTVTYTAVGLWPTEVSANGRYIKDQNGDPWMMHGDAAWDLAVNLTFAEMQTYLSDRDTKGFNLVLVEAPEHLFAPSAPANVNGDLPFTGTAFQSSLNEAYWRHVDAAVGLAASKGITILFACSYLGFSGTEEGWDTEVAAASNAQVQSYGAALGARYKDLPNIIWVAGADQTPSATLLDRLDHIVTGIQGTGDVHLWTAHNVVNHDAEETWGGYPWLDLNSVYASDPNIISEAAVSYGKATVRPTFHIEGKYFNFSGIALAQIRRQAWQAVLVGAIGGQIVGNEGIWSFGFNTGFSTNGYAWATRISDQESSDASVMAAFIDGLGGATWSALVPDLSDVFLTSGEGTSTTQAAASYSNDLGLVYLPAARSITVDLSKLTGHATAVVRWLDPTTGSFTSVGTLSTASQVITHPGNNAAGDSDWVLVAQGTTDVTGTVTVTLSPATSTATAVEKMTGTVTATLANATGAASGTVANPVTGTSTQTLANVTGSATSTETMTGTVARTLAAFIGAATGTVANPVTGTASSTLANFVGDGLGTIGGGTNGIAQPTLSDVTSSASGLVTITGVVAVQLANAAAGIAGIETISGTGTAVSPDFVSTATGTENFVGTSARTLAPFTGSAAGFEVVNIFGTAAADLANFTCVAFSTPSHVSPAPGDQYLELILDERYAPLVLDDASHGVTTLGF